MPLFLFPALATGLLLFFSSGTGRATDPNIIVFLADDMGIGGHLRLPGLDRQ